MTRRCYLVLALVSHGLNTLAQTLQSQFNQVINLNGDVRSTDVFGSDEADTKRR